MTDKQALKILQGNYDKLVEEFEQYRRESIKWSKEDFIMSAEDKGDYLITNEQAQEALEDMISHHSADIGINWDVIDNYIEKYGIKIKDL